MSLLAHAARHSHDSPDWYTPAPFVEAAREVLGAIDLDPASDADANRTVQAARYFTVEDDGLRQPWAGRVFLNPPGGQVADFWRALTRHITGSGVTAAVWIGYSLEQLQTLQRITAPWTPLDWPFCVPTKRIAFVENAAKRAVRLATVTGQGKAAHRGNRPSHANYIAYYGPHPDVFACVFSWFGHIVVPTGTVVTGPTLMTQTTEPHE